MPMKANLNWPAKGYLSSNFGYRWGRLHSGIDIAAPLGTTVYAAEGGKVIFAGWRKGYGRTVIIDHTHYRTLYAHLHRYNVRAGQFVTALQNIGAVGRSGNARGVHLHFEFRDSNDQPHNPIPFLPNNNYISMEDGTVRTGTM